MKSVKVHHHLLLVLLTVDRFDALHCFLRGCDGLPVEHEGNTDGVCDVSSRPLEYKSLLRGLLLPWRSLVTKHQPVNTRAMFCQQKIPLVEHLDGAEYSQMMFSLLLEHEDLEGVVICPGGDLGSVEAVESVHLAEDVPHHSRLGELQGDVALALFDVLTPHHG